jgi:phage/plasmid-like protein (TIGR03299 family)
MAHEIDQTTGKSAMAYLAGGETPWHGLGEAVPEEFAYDAHQFATSAIMDWEVGVKNLQTEDGIPVPNRATYRKDTGAILGVVGPRWTPLQNAQSFQWFQPWLDSRQCRLETAGVLFGGQKTWVLAKAMIDSLEIVAGDPVESFILLSNSHDGTTAVRAGFTPIRVVCNHTLRAATNNATSKLIRLTHSAQIVQNLGVIQDIMDLAKQEFVATAEQYQFLANKGVNSADLSRYARICLGFDADCPVADLPTRSKGTLSEVIGLCIEGIGQDIPGVRGSWWGAYNGINEYLNYAQGRDANNRLDSLWFGPNCKKNQQAFDLAIKMAS